jgi:hypothetical protein
VIVFPKGAIQTNSKIKNLIKLIKPYIIHFLDSSAMVICQENLLLLSVVFCTLISFVSLSLTVKKAQTLDSNTDSASGGLQGGTISSNPSILLN